VASKRRPTGTPANLSAPGSRAAASSKAEDRRAKRVAAAEQAKRELAARQRRSRLMGVGAIILAVVVVVAIVVAVGLLNNQKGAKTTTASDEVISAVTSIPVATFDKVGAGSIKTLPSAITADLLTADGKPRVLYVGAEYCPFCAAERWSLVAALARFGTFTGLGQTASTPKDVYPNTPTLSFHGSTYSSQYLSFTGYETEDTNGKQLETLSSEDEALVQKYNAPPYVGTGDTAGSIPFLNLFGSYVSQGASYSPQILAGMSHAEVAHAMQDPTTEVAKNVDAMANIFSAIICKATDQQPAEVCTSSGVQAGAAKLPTS
jgi:lipopolysaccharide export system protein LptC